MHDPTQATKSRPRRPFVALPETLNPEQRLTAEQVQALVGIGRSALYEAVASGALPQPERFSPRLVRWRAGDVLATLAARRAK